MKIISVPINVQLVRLLFPVYTTLTNYVAVCHTNQREHTFYTVYMKFRLQAFLPNKYWYDMYPKQKFLCYPHI